MELTASERFAYLKEMFPNIPDEILTEQLQGLPDSSSVDQLVDYFLSISENFGPSLPPETEGEGKALEMVSLTPGVWNSKSEKPHGDMIRKIKEQQEAEDEALARKLYQEEVHQKEGGKIPPSSSSSSTSSARDLLAEANSLRLSRQTDLLKRKEPTPAPAAAAAPAPPLPLKPKPKPAAAKQSLREQMEEVRRMRRSDWRGNRDENRSSSSGGASSNPAVGILGKAPVPIYNGGSGSRGGGGGGMPLESNGGGVGYYDQLRQAREKWKKEWRNTKMGRQRVWTLNDIENQRKAEEETNARDWLSSDERRGVHTFGNTVLDPLRIGKEALELSNAFRAKNKLPPLKWHQSLCDIGVKHSKDMGDGKVPFGHQGFDQRVSQFPFAVHSAAENVAMSNGFSDVARVAVNGWIESPGHRKNLLSSSYWCGIGVYRNSQGAFYLTQLFAS